MPSEFPIVDSECYTKQLGERFLYIDLTQGTCCVNQTRMSDVRYLMIRLNIEFLLAYCFAALLKRNLGKTKNELRTRCV